MDKSIRELIDTLQKVRVGDGEIDLKVLPYQSAERNDHRKFRVLTMT